MTTETTTRTVRYVGRRTNQGVTVLRELDDGSADPLPLRLDLRSHSPSGFDWGYAGSGPSQLALAVASDAVGDRWAMTQQNYQAFKFARIATLAEETDWAMSRDEVVTWFEREAKPCEELEEDLASAV